MRVFYDYKRAVCGKSKIMYRGKWYLLLDATSEYVVIRCRNVYTKINKYDVEDCTYHDVVYEDNCMPRFVNKKEMAMIRKTAFNRMAHEYDIDEINACKDDLSLYRSKNMRLFFLSNMLTKFISNSSDSREYTMFKSFVESISNLPMGTDRRGLNIIMVDTIDPCYYSSVNALLNRLCIFTDNEAMRCLSYDFVTELLYIIEGA